MSKKAKKQHLSPLALAVGDRLCELGFPDPDDLTDRKERAMVHQMLLDLVNGWLLVIRDTDDPKVKVFEMFHPRKRKKRKKKNNV